VGVARGSHCLLTLAFAATEGALLAKKQYKGALESYDARAARVARFVHSIRPNLPVQSCDCDSFASFTADTAAAIQLCPIVEPFGPSVIDPAIDVLVVSQETRGGVEAVNSARAARSLAPVAGHVIGLVIDPTTVSAREHCIVLAHMDMQGEKTSSTTLRMRRLAPAPDSAEASPADAAMLAPAPQSA
jgi:phosphopantetheine adenylyltransferase